MKILDAFIHEFKSSKQENEKFEKSLEGDIKRVKSALMNEEFLPSIQLEDVLNKQLRRCHYPIEIAIVGQFSSGKSTFLNALLSKDILPMGITPVTSKVTYINYADEYKLKITYHSGVEKYFPVEEISKFSDQREEGGVQNIKYLSIYAPIELLKEISFVDTPGLNSQSSSDTQETLKALHDVGGIIWLSLIDNSGKLSESEVLEKYMKNFKDKSLCILNQKDKFTQEQIAHTKNYIEKKFSNYFTKVIPISAKKALEARGQQKDILLQSAENDFLQFMTDAIKEKIASQDLYCTNYETYTQRVTRIEEGDYTNIMNLQNESNIDEVLDFINQSIKPQAKDAKVFVIKKDLRGICDILIQEYQVLIEVHISLILILEKLKDTISKKFDAINEVAQSDLAMLYENFKFIIDDVALEIYKSVEPSTAYYYEEKSGFLSKESYSKKECNSFSINMENVYKNLFYDNQKLDKKIKKLTRNLKQVDVNLQNSFDDIFQTIKQKVVAWQNPYELIKKNREISSDLEFSGTRHFASKAYENILQYYASTLSKNIDELHKNFSYFQAMLESSSFEIVNSSLHHFEARIKESVELYIEDSKSFSLYHPREEEIVKSLQSGFKFEKIESFLLSNRNIVKKVIYTTKDEYMQTTQERIDFIKEKQKLLESKVEKIVVIKEKI